MSERTLVPVLLDEQEHGIKGGIYGRNYYRGLKEWQTGGEREYLRDTCLLMQDNMKSILDYYKIEYSKESPTSQEAE